MMFRVIPAGSKTGPLTQTGPVGKQIAPVPQVFAAPPGVGPAGVLFRDIPAPAALAPEVSVGCNTCQCCRGCCGCGSGLA